MPVTPLRAADPTSVGPHRLLARLGQGGMGTVYLGIAPDQRAVAVKVLRDGLDDPDARRRFGRELDALGRVRGAHLVEVLAADLDAEPPYLVTRFVPGRRLDEVVQQDGPLAGPALLRVARGLADALAVLHGAGVVHRDLTPGNVLLLDGEPQVIDLGLATVADVTALTRSGLIVGTPGYLAPEQVLGRPVGAAVDVHAWGATLALAGTGRPPFGTGRADAVLYRIVHDRPDLSGLPAEVAAVVALAMAPDPLERPSAPWLLERLGGRADDAEPMTVHLPRDIEPTEVLATDLLHLRRLATPPRTLVGAGSGPHALPAYPSEQPTSLLARPDTPADAATRMLRRDPGPPQTRYLDDEPAPAHQASDDEPGDDPARAERFPDGDPPAGPSAIAGWDDPRWEPPFGAGLVPGAVLADPAEEPQPRRHPVRSLQVAVTAAAGVGVVVAGALVAPALAALSTLALLVVLRAASRSSDRHHDRRDRRGRRRRDPVLRALGAPWHLLRGLLDTVLSLPLVALAAAVPAGLVWLTDPAAPGLERPELTAAAATGAGLLAALARSGHRQSRRSLRAAMLALTPHPTSAVVLLVGLLAAAALLLATAQGQAPVWLPVTVANQP